jgi:UDP-GlcNAc3NAcA epimerase
LPTKESFNRKKMIKILTIIGARPQIIKAAALSRAIRNRFSGTLKEVIVHTGQHYDENMSEVFFRELAIPRPDYNLNVGSASHGRQTAAMIAGIEEIIEKESPGCIVVYGDTNSTLAGAVAASKIHLPVVHIEAGLRSFNKSMPEEVNRIMCDHVSTLLFSPTAKGVENLVRESFSHDPSRPVSIDNPRIYHCGDVMYDNSMHFSEVAEKNSTVLSGQEGDYILATIHRNNNTDDPARLTALFRAFDRISRSGEIDILLPLHPRTSRLLEQNLDAGVLASVRSNTRIRIMPPVSFLDMIVLEKNARLVMTDSGGVQKEAFFFRRPCIILRPETEWVELVEAGTALITDADEEKIISAFGHFCSDRQLSFPALYGDGHAAEFICSEIVRLFSKAE